MAKEKTPKVSVIIPMYNAEKYIGECLQSLLNQTLKNFEVLVVDDCSTDNSLTVAESFTDTFKNRGVNFLTFKGSQNSGRPGIPRNFAMDFAKGKYIYFLDSDDFLDKTALEDLFKVAENFQADVVHVEKSFAYEKINGKIIDEIGSPQKGEFVKKPTLETSDIGKRIADFTNRRYMWWACNKLFNRKFLLENNIKFPEAQTFEDCVFAFQCLVCAKNYVRVPFCSYHYRFRQDSMSHKMANPVEVIYNTVNVISFLDNFMSGKKIFLENPQNRYAMLDFLISERVELLSKNLFIASKLDPAEVYAFLCQNIFSIAPEKNAAWTSYFFVKANIYHLLVNQQAAEIERLKKLLQEK